MSLSLNTQALLKLEKFFLENAPLCVHDPEGMLKHRYVTPTYSVVPGADDEDESEQEHKNEHVASVVPERSRIGHYLQMYD